MDFIKTTSACPELVQTVKPRIGVQTVRNGRPRNIRTTFGQRPDTPSIPPERMADSRIDPEKHRPTVDHHSPATIGRARPHRASRRVTPHDRAAQPVPHARPIRPIRKASSHVRPNLSTISSVRPNPTNERRISRPRSTRPCR
ncbi:unnamed protein product [Microthlaspi erraticum]|uniref:Uncharacterized protein n=1 Tax=Microthlaspi erraticum TaxID=1685480 RepID=A0A6D2KR84_9BRAS|nr:unnamed protein product [Microthlaspi erraticum]